MITLPIKYKRGELYLLNNQEVYIYTSNRSDGKLSVCTDRSFSDISGFKLVLPSDLSNASSKPKQGIIAKISPKQKGVKQPDRELNTFYDEMGKVMPFNCQNCNKPLYAHNKFFRRCTAAHILAKSDYPSIATNSDNIIFLGCGIIGVCDCHSSYDLKGAAYRATMPCYPLVLSRYEKLKDYLTEKERFKAEIYLFLAKK
jgi:hypothetical protein